MKIGLSPSSQEHNPYTGGGTEEEWMRVLMSKAQPRIISRGHDCRLYFGTLAEQVAAANADKVDVLLDGHSNAGGGHGSTAYIHHFDGGIRETTARALVANIAALDPHFRNRGVAANGDTFYSIRESNMPTILLETLFHDCAYEAAYIREHTDDLAEAIAEAFPNVQAQVQVPVPQPSQGAPVPVPDVPAPPVQVPVPATPAPLAVDGVWGPGTTQAWQKRRGLAGDGSMGGQSIMDAQRRFGTAVDGMVSGQATRSHLPSWVKDRVKIGTGGSRLIRAVAADLEAHGYATNGSDRDGLAGSGFVKAVQRRINADPNYLKG